MSSTDTNQASELYKLCKEVYERTHWEDDKMWGASWEAIHYEQYKSDNLVDPKTPLYTSDYLLEKLREAKQFDVTVTDSYQYDGIGDWRAGEHLWMINDWGTYATANTPLKALLKLTIALHKAGELKLPIKLVKINQ